MRTATVNGTSLAYEDTGPGSTGQTIAFAHGLLWDRTLFAPQIAALRGRYRCIAWDHRGQGDSAGDPERGCIGMELVTQDALALLASLAAGPVHFVGLSMGGFVGMRIAARYPARLASLMLLETSADPEPAANLPKYRMLTAITRWLHPRLVARSVMPVMFGKHFLGDPSRARDRATYAKLMTRRRDIWRAVNGVLDRPGIADELGSIRMPTLVVVGEQDTATVPAKAEALQRAIPGAQLVRIADAGHSSTVEQPVAVTAALEKFLATQHAGVNVA